MPGSGVGGAGRDAARTDCITQIALMIQRDYGNVRRLLFAMFHAGEIRKEMRGQYVLAKPYPVAPAAPLRPGPLL